MAKTKKPFGPDYKKYTGERGSAEQWVAVSKKVFGVDSNGNEVETEEEKEETEEEKTPYTVLLDLAKKGRKLKWK